MQVRPFRDETRLDAGSLDTKSALRVVIAYHDLAAGQRALRVLTDLGKALAEDFAVQLIPAGGAVHADGQVRVTNGDQPLPAAGGRWAEAVLTRRKCARGCAESLAQSRRRQEQLRHLSHQLLAAQEAERKKISRELHDEIAQSLTGINLRLAELKQAAATTTKDLAKKITRLQRQVAQSVDAVHRFARELRCPVLDDLGLIPALHAVVKSVAKRTGLHIHLTAFAAVEELDTDKRTVLYRVAQEALANVARHAHASRVSVSLQKLPAAVSLVITDDGQSFSVQQVLRAKRNGRLGLVGMRERVEMVGGSFRVESAPGQGTTVRAEIPLAKARGRRGRKTG